MFVFVLVAMIMLVIMAGGRPPCHPALPGTAAVRASAGRARSGTLHKTPLTSSKPKRPTTLKARSFEVGAGGGPCGSPKMFCAHLIYRRPKPTGILDRVNSRCSVHTFSTEDLNLPGSSIVWILAARIGRTASATSTAFARWGARGFRVALLVWRYLSNTASFVFYGITCLIRPHLSSTALLV